jgi:hypothetical protein
MGYIAAIGGHAIAARSNPDNLFCNCHSAPCPRRAAQSTGDFACRFGCRQVLTFDLRRQAIFVVTGVDFDHAIAEQADFGFIKAVGRRQSPAIGQYIKATKATIGMSNDKNLAFAACDLLGGAGALKRLGPGQRTFDFSIQCGRFVGNTNLDIGIDMGFGFAPGMCNRALIGWSDILCIAP